MPQRLQLPTNFALPTSWEEAAEHARASPEMADAVAYFRKILGDRWPGWANRAHLARSFYTRMQSEVYEWVRLYRLARVLVGDPELETLVRNLGKAPWSDHLAAEQALEFCSRCRAAGHRVELLGATNAVSPDATVWFHDRPVTVEFKALHTPNARAPWDAFEDALVGGLRQRGAHDPEGQFPFRITFAAPALAHTEAIVDTLAQLFAARDPALRDLPHGAGQAQFVADRRAARGWLSPVPQRDDLARVVPQLGRNWVRQLEAVDGPTLVIGLTENLFVASDADALNEARHIASVLRDCLRARAVPGAVLLHEEPFLPPSAPVLHLDDGWRFTRGSSDGRARSALLVQSGSARIPLTADELEVLIGPTMPW
jgi:hypothetical protein